MNRRLTWIACALAVVGAGILLLYLQRFEREVGGGERIELLLVRKPLARGALLTEEALATRAVPRAYVEERAIRAVDRDKVLGIPTALALEPQQTLLWTDLALGNEGESVENLIAPGRRAVSVRAGGLEAASALVRPGHHVDVIFTARAHDTAAQAGARVLLQNVLVLAVGGDTRAGFRELEPGQRDSTLTLSLSLEEAQLIALAQERGRLTVALRNPTDPGIANDVPQVSVRALLPSAASAASSLALSPAVAPASAPERAASLR